MSDLIIEFVYWDGSPTANPKTAARIGFLIEEIASDRSLSHSRSYASTVEIWTSSLRSAPACAYQHWSIRSFRSYTAFITIYNIPNNDSGAELLCPQLVRTWEWSVWSRTSKYNGSHLIIFLYIMNSANQVIYHWLRKCISLCWATDLDQCNPELVNSYLDKRLVSGRSHGAIQFFWGPKILAGESRNSQFDQKYNKSSVNDMRVEKQDAIPRQLGPLPSCPLKLGWSFVSIVW